MKMWKIGKFYIVTESAMNTISFWLELLDRHRELDRLRMDREHTENQQNDSQQTDSPMADSQQSGAPANGAAI